jgi:hypothetical protein
MANLDLLDLTTQVRAIGRGSVFYEAGAFAFAAGGTDASLTHLGDTEGEIDIVANEEYSALTLPELTGPAPHEKYVAGQAPVITLPLYAADAALRAITAPTGSASGGYERRRSVTEYTLAIIPEQVFIESNAQAQLTYDKVSEWEVGGDAATAAQLAILDLSFWGWRGHFTVTMPMFRHEDGGKVVQNVEFHLMHNGSMPDGHKLFTIGRPDQATTPIHISST